LNRWRDAAKSHDGRVVVTRCPAGWKTPDLVWGPPADDTWVMREVKTKFDPRRLFNPGRFVDGL
jgi:FAD/FMN-containing dehydrogenase